MGDMPGMPFFSVKRCFTLAVFAFVPACALAELPQSAPPQTATTSQTQTAHRKTLGLDQSPAEMRADILMARGEYVAAIAAYQQTDLRSAIVWNNIGMAYHHLFALEEARKAYQTALSLNPRFAPAANNLAAIYYAQREFSLSEHWYKRALKHTSESAVIYANLGTAYFAEAKYKKGVKEYRKAFALDQKVFTPRDAAMVQAGSSREQRVEMNYFVAETFASAGQKDQALVYLRKAMDEGFKDRKRLIEDKEFASLRTTPEFQQLMDQENLN
jgi:tetratricopeptide (TPR) repeat protein